MDKKKCPYCNRKISYTTRLIEHGDAEHDCPNCNKTSKITQDSRIWALLLLCSIFALFILIFSPSCSCRKTTCSLSFDFHVSVIELSASVFSPALVAGFSSGIKALSDIVRPVSTLFSNKISSLVQANRKTIVTITTNGNIFFSIIVLFNNFY